MTTDRPRASREPDDELPSTLPPGPGVPDVPVPRREPTPGQLAEVAPPVTDFWTLMNALLNSDEMTSRLVRLAAFLTATAVAGVGALGLMVLLVPQAHFAATWGWPTAGVATASNLVAWRVVRRRLKSTAASRARSATKARKGSRGAAGRDGARR